MDIETESFAFQMFMTHSCMHDKKMSSFFVTFLESRVCGQWILSFNHTEYYTIVAESHALQLLSKFLFQESALLINTHDGG